MPTRTALSLALAAGLALGVSLPAQAQSMAASAPAMAKKAGAARVARGDATFVRDAAAGGMAEVALGEMATQKGAAPRVKQFGERMVADHGKTNQELMQIASSKGITAPAQPTPQQRRDAEMLRRTSGDAFDRGYARQMVADHRTTIALFEKEAKSGRDPELKAFADRTLPALREHLEMARGLGTDTPAAGAAMPATMPMAK